MESIYRCLGEPSPEYAAKMLHAVPDAPVTDRVSYILNRAAGKRVLHLGSASGSLHKALHSIAAEAVGLDREPPADMIINLDKPVHIPGRYDMVVAGEILEHLANPGSCLEAVRELRCPVIITVPNAHAQIGTRHIVNGIENVNLEHVAYYSYWTLKQLVERYRFQIREFLWYNGQPYTAEGLIFQVD